MDERADSTPADSGLAAGIAAVLDWWREAGVDCAFHDEPAQWLSHARPLADAAAEARRGPARTQPALPGRGLAGEQGSRVDARSAPSPGDAVIDTSAWPGDLASFTDWWLNEPWLDDGRPGGAGSGRVPPRGQEQAEVMVLIPDPEREDDDRLLSGPQGRLLDAMLSAFGIAAEQAYVASVLPRHTPMADWRRLGALGFPALIAHHVRLVSPKRLICLGHNILPLLETEPPNNAANPTNLIHSLTNTPLLAIHGLSALLGRPGLKAEVWRNWQNWTANDPVVQRAAKGSNA
jgi:uracil-DNA glycosylase